VLGHEVAQHRREGPVRPFLVVEFHADHRLGDLADGQVAEIEVLEHPAAQGIVLDPDGRVQRRAVQAAVLGEDVADVAGDLATDGDPAMATVWLGEGQEDARVDTGRVEHDRDFQPDESVWI